MKHIYQILVFSLLFMCSCQVEPLPSDNLPVNNQNNQSQDDSEDENECETLFAWGPDVTSTCFLDDGFHRWGWTIGPLASGEYTFDLYAGAGQCDLEKGTLVGTLNVNYNEDEGTADVEFTMLEGYVLNETHLYIGNDPYPTSSNGQITVAPGQFPYQHELDNTAHDSYTIEDLSGEIYIIAHGVVCNDTDDDDDDDDGGGGAF